MGFLKDSNRQHIDIENEELNIHEENSCIYTCIHKGMLSSKLRPFRRPQHTYNVNGYPYSDCTNMYLQWIKLNQRLENKTFALLRRVDI